MKRLVIVFVLFALLSSFLAGFSLSGYFESWKVSFALSLLLISFFFGGFAIYMVFLLGQESVKFFFNASPEIFFVKLNKKKLWVISKN